VEVPQTKYARTSDGLFIAYQIVGEASVDLVFAAGAVTHLEVY